MVEGSEVDWASHDNDPVGTITDYLAFDKAVKVALEFARTHPERPTLVLVVPDHDNGGMSLGNRTTYSYMFHPDDMTGMIKKALLTADGAARLIQAMDGVPAGAFTLLAYHSPDLIREATERQVDLYLGGHTHGGQLRLPFYGAIVTCSIYGKQYESGLFVEDGTAMYISRGVGFEGGGMPRARFLCRPEIVSIELSGTEGP
jgi:predicted MPP superfamily phosphohydrolase